MHLSILQASAWRTWRPVLLMVLCGASLTAALWADDWPRPPSGEVRLRNGRLVDYTIHFDRNSLRDSLRVDDGLIALTSSGALLRFELPAVRLFRERIDDEVVCIGRGEGNAVLAGLADGRVCRVDPVTLALTDVVELPAGPSWLGWCAAGASRPAGLVAVTRQTRRVEQGGRQWDQAYTVVLDCASGKTFAIDHGATAVLLDRAGRLWVGDDHGEWAGHVSRIDLSKGVVAALNAPPTEKVDNQNTWLGVYGFIELHDGQVWAYGGMSHMFYNVGVISRVDEADARTLVAFHPPVDARLPEAKPSRPRMPITDIVEEKDGLLVFSYSDVFRVDRALEAWTSVATLKLHYRAGRPDAVGAYPAVRTIHPPIHEGEPYLLATIGDGYVALDGQKASPCTVSGQITALIGSTIVNTSEGPLVFDDDLQRPTWRLGANGWETVTLAPPLQADRVDVANGFVNSGEGWNVTRVLVGPGGAVYTVSGTDAHPGTRCTAQRVNGKTVRLGQETSTLDAASSFITADGTLWNASYDGLRRFQNGRWQTVEELPHGGFPRGPIKPLNLDGPPWLLLDHYRKRLWRLDHGAKGEKPRLTRVEVLEDGNAVAIDDGIPWTSGTLLLATGLGMRAYVPALHELSRINLPEPPGLATLLVRDGLGRLWLLGGGKIWLSEPGAKTPETFDRVPWVGRSRVNAIAPDPQHADGIIAVLGSRGVAFVQARQKP